jgi:MSHA biogenesis protein MshG
MQYSYQGRDSAGNLAEGVMEALSAEDAASAVQRTGITLVSLEEKAVAFDVGEAFSEWMIARTKVSLDDLVILCRQMNALSRAGIPIMRSIRGLSDSSTSVVLRRCLAKVAERLDGGVDLATCLRDFPHIFDELFIAMIHVGENTGNLDGAFKQLGVNIELERTTRQRVQQAVRYPLMVVSALSVAMLIINIWVIPSFSDVFAKLGAELPLPTVILIAISNAFLSYWWLMLAVVVIAAYAFAAWVATDNGRYEWDRIKLKLPIIGPLLFLVALSRFSRNFAMMLAAGLPITQALVLVSSAVGNSFVGKAVAEMRAGIERGDTLVSTAGSSGMFSSLVMQMLAVGEETGQIDDLLIEVADFYDEEVEYRLSRLSDAIEPILIFAMGLMVLVLALGVFLPIWSLGEASMSK